MLMTGWKILSIISTGFYEQPLVRAILEQSSERMSDYERFGCEFFHKPDGSLKSVPQRGFPMSLYPAQEKGARRRNDGQMPCCQAEKTGRTAYWPRHADQLPCARWPDLRRCRFQFHQRRFSGLQGQGSGCLHGHGRLENILRQEYAHWRGHEDGFRDRLRSAGSGIFPGLEYAEALCPGKARRIFPAWRAFCESSG